jgi:signal transduction histidine kinase
MSYSAIEVHTTHKVTTNVPWELAIAFQAVALGKPKRLFLIAANIAGRLITAFLFIPALDVLPAVVAYFLFQGAVIYFGDLIEREDRAKAALNETNRKLAEYAQQAEELAVAKERNRMAREIHDNLGHYLTAVNMQIEAALAVMKTDSDLARHSLERAQGLTKEGLSEIRRSIAALRASPTETRPLHEAILTLVKEHQAAGMALSYQVDGIVRPCSAQLEMALYRIAQEGLTNVRKHSGASQTHLALNYLDPQKVGLQLRDNGIGAAQFDGGFGLLGIRERVELLDGKINILTAPGEGFALQVEMPT